MPSAAEELFDRAVGHQIGLLRFSNSVRDKMVAHLNRVEDDLIRQIRKRADAGTFTEWRLNKILEDVRGILAEARPETYAIVRDELVELASYEAGYAEQGLRNALQVQVDITKPARAQLRAAVLSRPFQGKILREWVSELDGAQRRNIRDAIRIGFTEGEGIDQIVRRIRGTRALQYRDGIMEITRRHANAMVRTAVNHTSNYAREALYAENDDIVRGVRWVSTLDSRTTEICMARDQKEYPLNSGPRPPAHVGCRSTTVPILLPASEIFGKDVDDLSEGTRASIDGPIPEGTTYNDWLKRQPAAVQDEVLGSAKGKLFRDGGMSVDRFVDERTGHVYGLEELRKRDEAAFARAGL